MLIEKPLKISHKAKATSKQRVYLNEYNVLMDKTVYLPLVSGLLQAYAQNSSSIIAAYEFAPYLFVRQEPETLIRQYKNPSIAAFSVFMWNEQLSLHVAREVKRIFPKCIVIFGGQQVPHDAREYLTQYPFIDIAVNGEGEETFLDILQQSLLTNDYSSIQGITWRHSKTGSVTLNDDRALISQPDHIPSPYLGGLFDNLIIENPDLKFQAIIQSNRGCPFSCAYCSWHKNSSLRYFNLSRVAAELEWCGKNGIQYIFSADSNFGIHKRDLEIAQYLVDTNKRFGCPEKFRSCFTKNADARIFELSMLLFNNGLEKGVTLSFQSLNENALKNVKRENIKLSTYKNLLAKFNSMHVPIYTELILGLPGETESSWLEGIDSILNSGLQGQLFIYPCEVYPNTLMADSIYRKEFGIVTQKIRLTEIHGIIRPDSSIEEFQEIIIATNSMPHKAWRKMLIFSWTIMLLYSLKLGFFVLRYLKDRFDVSYMSLVEFLIINAKGVIRRELLFFESQVTAIVDGNGRGVPLPEYGSIYWDTEEASYLRLSVNIDDFYQELNNVVLNFINSNNTEFNSEELAEVFKYQSVRIPRCSSPTPVTVNFSYNIPEYFEDGSIPISKGPMKLECSTTNYSNNYKQFAKETVLWGRKSNRLLNNVSWER